MKINFLIDPQCKNCDLCESTPKICHRTETYHTNGNKKCILFIGQFPDYHASIQEMAFVGRNGTILKKAYIQGSGLEKYADIYITNMVRCNPDQNQKAKNSHYKECFSFTYQDLKTLHLMYKEIAVVLLGAPTISAFFKFILNGKKMTLKESLHSNGKEYKIDLIKFKVFSTYHPNACLFEYNNINAVESHMKMIKSWVKGKIPLRSDPVWIESVSPSKYFSENFNEKLINYKH